MQHENKTVSQPVSGISQSPSGQSLLKRFQGRNHVIYCWLRAAFRFIFVSMQTEDRQGYSILSREWSYYGQEIDGAWLVAVVAMFVCAPFVWLGYYFVTNPLGFFVFLTILGLFVLGGFTVWGIGKIVPRLIEFLTGQKDP